MRSASELGIIENMSTFVCHHCGEVSKIFGQGGAEADARRLGVMFLGAVPLHMAMVAATVAFTFVVALLTISYQVIKTALANPVDSIRYE